MSVISESKRSCMGIMPTPDELARLPTNAIQALICRCVRRLERIFIPNVSDEQADDLDEAARVFQQTLERAERFTGQEVHEDPPAEVTISGSARVWAIQAALMALRALRSLSAKDSAGLDLAAVSLKWASGAAAHWVSRSEDKISAAVRRDFEVLCEVPAHENPENDAPALEELLGPIWPDGEPDGWSTG